MAKDGKNVRAIERELAEHFATPCLDNRPERLKVARWIAQREEGIAAVAPPPAARAANDPSEPLPALTIAEAGPAPSGFGLHRIPVYDVKLVQSRRPLMLPYRLADNPDASARAFHTLIGLTDREHLACLFVNAQHEINGAHVAAIGGQGRINNIDPRVIFRAALAACATAIVLGHNHPSNDPTPSAEDIATTEGLMKAAVIVNMPVLDHVIVTRERNRYSSMVERGIMPKVF
jgi:DNA repair protein RadC